MTTFLEEWDMPDELGKVSLEVMACLTVKMMQITDIFPHFPHAIRQKKKKKNNNSNKKKIIHRNFVNHKIFWSEIIGLRLSTSIK